MCLIAFSLSNPLLTIFPLVGQVVALVFSLVGLAQIKKSGGTRAGRWMANTGIATSVAVLLVIIAILLFGLSLTAAVPTS
jgi:hypothetical protein